MDKEEEWGSTPSGDDCAWCAGPDDYTPEDADDAEQVLCPGHLAEYLGVSLAYLHKLTESGE